MSDRMKLQIVPDPQVTAFLEQAIPPMVDMQQVSHPCPHCGVTTRYPLSVSEGDYKAMQELLALAERYLTEKGVMATMISEVMARAHIAKAARKPPPG